jgi:hypothetical protein
MPRVASRESVGILARGWVRIMWQCWKTQTPYNPERHLKAA